MSVLLPGRNLVLIGLMGSGKTTVGELLARRLERPLVDTDEMVEREAGKAIKEIFAEEGERGFRRHESEAIRRVAAIRGQVMAVGGGAVLDPGNVTQLSMTGDLVLLDAPPEVLSERLDETETAERPLVADADDLTARLAHLLEERRGDYERAASLIVDTAGRDPEGIAEEILEWALTRPGLLSRDEREEIEA
jgi:shikimate kinase